MRYPTGAALPRSFVSDAEDIAVVLRARQVRRNLARLRLALLLLVGVGLFTLLGLSISAHVRRPTFGCRGMQSEAKSTLKAMYVQQESFRVDYNRYGAAPVDVGFAPKVGAKQRYRYALTDVTNASFTAWAFGVADDVLGDVWRITEAYDLQNVTSACQ